MYSKSNLPNYHLFLSKNVMHVVPSLWQGLGASQVSSVQLTFSWIPEVEAHTCGGSRRRCRHGAPHGRCLGFGLGQALGCFLISSGVLKVLQSLDHVLTELTPLCDTKTTLKSSSVSFLWSQDLKKWRKMLVSPSLVISKCVTNKIRKWHH